MTYASTVQSMYIAYYGRPGDPAGIDWWAAQLASVGGNLDAILPAFGYSAEYLDRYGNLGTDELITQFYLQIFNRAPDAGGLAWYRGLYESGKAGLADIAKWIWDGASGADFLMIQNKAEVADAFTAQIRSTGGSYTAADIDRAVALLSSVDDTQASVGSALDTVAQWFIHEPVPAAEPTAYEQYMLEIINWERANPVDAAAYYGIDLNEGLAPGTLHTGARQPLAMNLDLIEAARNHSEWMLQQDVFSHTGAGASRPWDRMEAAGYTGYTRAGENIAWIGTTGSYADSRIPGDTATLERNLFVDENYAGRGHRINILNDGYKEIGIGIELGQYQQYNVMMATQDFGARTGNSFLLGVVFDDENSNQFYDIGEGVWQASITATHKQTAQTFSTETYYSGGYQLQLPDGQYEVEISHTGKFITADIQITGSNTKLDWVTDVLML